MKMRVVVTGFLWLSAAIGATAQVKMPPETKNAALRYWQAFAEIKDPPSDKATQELLEKTAAGDVDWNEAKLGAILNLNMSAIEMFQRATTLPDCDWGVEYGRGVRASIAYAPRARVLARLNTLAGIREMATGETQTAVDTWLAGLRFTAHLAKGGSLIFALIAKSALLPNLHALSTAANQGKLTEGQKRQITSAVGALPADGFDWSRAWELEQAGGDQFFDELQHAKDPAGFYESVVGKPAPNSCVPPKLQDVRAYNAYMANVAAALHRRPADTKEKLSELDTQANRLCEAIHHLVPSVQRINEARLEISTARGVLLQALQSK